MKIARHGQSIPIDRELFGKILAGFQQAHHQLIWKLLFYTGERISAVLALRVEDVYDAKGKVRAEVNFRSSTRKDRRTRQVPVHRELKLALKFYTPPTGEFLFPSKSKLGWMPRRVFDLAFRSALRRVGLEGYGVSLHGTRHGFITNLHQSGVSLFTIQDITGHSDIRTLRGYTKSSPQQIEKAIALR